MHATNRSGFTLVEVMVALTILAIGIMAIMRIFPESMRQSQQAAERQQVAFLAKTELGNLRAAGIRNLVGEWANNNAYQNIAAAGGNYGMYKSWTTSVNRISSDVDLYRVTFNVEMHDGRRERFVTYVTEQ